MLARQLSSWSTQRGRPHRRTGAAPVEGESASGGDARGRHVVVARLKVVVGGYGLRGVVVVRRHSADPKASGTLRRVHDSQSFFGEGVEFFASQVHTVCASA